MMRNPAFSYCTLFLVLLFPSCGENDPEPLQSEVQAILLAGKSGNSKNWRLISISEKAGINPEQNYALEECFLDNVFTFRNNPSQDYEAIEGPTKCDPLDPEIAESGTWAFTTEGKILIILPDTLTNSYNILFTLFTYPSAVIELTEDSLKLRMSIVDNDISHVYNLSFVKI
jgi:hypothetical protein